MQAYIAMNQQLKKLRMIFMMTSWPVKYHLNSMELTEKKTETAKTFQRIKVSSRKSKKGKKKIRFEVIITSNKGDVPYTDILGRVKADPELKDL